VVAFEEAGRVGYAGYEAAPRGTRGGDEVAAGLLLEKVMNYLEGRRAALLDCVDAFLAPTDGRTKGGAPGAHLTLALEAVKLVKEGVLAKSSHAGVVELEPVDAVGAQALEAGLDGTTDKGGREVLG